MCMAMNTVRNKNKTNYFGNKYLKSEDNDFS